MKTLNWHGERSIHEPLLSSGGKERRWYPGRENLFFFKGVALSFNEWPLIRNTCDAQIGLIGLFKLNHGQIDSVITQMRFL